MKRRHFLQQAGAVAVGVSGGLGASHGATQRQDAADPRSAEAKRRRPAVLITSAHSPLAQELAAGLRGSYRVMLTGPSAPGESDLPFTRSALDPSPATRALVRGIDAIVHLAEPPADVEEAEWLDEHPRGTYHLLRAAVEEGVGTLVYLSSLALMTAYDEQFAVDEDWRPRPTIESGSLAHHLGEFTCREFAREGKLRVTVLRLGKVVWADEAAGPAPDSLAVDSRDVVQAVARVLALQLAAPAPRLGAWSVFHILSGSPHARFSIARARRILGYQPQRLSPNTESKGAGVLQDPHAASLRAFAEDSRCPRAV